MNIVLGLVLCLVGIGIFGYHAFHFNERDFRNFIAGGIAGIAFLFGLVSMSAERITTEYVPAEIVCQNELSTYFVDVNSGHVFHVDAHPNHTMDVPYLLDIETHGTHSKLDDEVLVVWRTD